MSAATVENNMMFCASCGTAGSDDIQLKRCNGCYLVRYCSIKCQKDHRPKHKKECKRRAAELKDEILFKQPESTHLGDCPICCLPLPIGVERSAFMNCCSKRLCVGCTHANMEREYEGRLQHSCPFCREVAPSSDEEQNERVMRRVEVNDPAAMCHMGKRRCDEGDYKAAFEYWTKAASLGDADAHYQLSCLYCDGKGVEKDENKELHHLTEAAIVGHPEARNNLGCVEGLNGRNDRAAKHFIIAAKLGVDKSLQAVTKAYRDGYVSKDDFEAAIRGHKAAVDATKSPQRKAAAEFIAGILADDTKA